MSLGHLVLYATRAAQRTLSRLAEALGFPTLAPARRPCTGSSRFRHSTGRRSADTRGFAMSANRLSHASPVPRPSGSRPTASRSTPYPGESLATALLADGRRGFRRTRSGAPERPALQHGSLLRLPRRRRRPGRGARLHDRRAPGSQREHGRCGPMDATDVASSAPGPLALPPRCSSPSIGAEVVVVDERPARRRPDLPPAARVVRAARGFRPDAATPRAPRCSRPRRRARHRLAHEHARLGSVRVAGCRARRPTPSQPAGSSRSPTKPAARRLAARHVLVAAGAYDLPVAFPGWTLPGRDDRGRRPGVPEEREARARAALRPRRRASAPARRRGPAAAPRARRSPLSSSCSPRPGCPRQPRSRSRLRGRVAPCSRSPAPLRRLHRHRVPLPRGHS